MVTQTEEGSQLGDEHQFWIQIGSQKFPEYPVVQNEQIYLLSQLIRKRYQEVDFQGFQQRLVTFLPLISGIAIIMAMAFQHRKK
eukprot:5840011-Heterocapsa_arctica.AAC.1